ncbi:hypothetical protein BDA99DRAFT_596965 [Phascolomyces articulosus]|uniref:Uncharacterized protein n=1 Tax=Phascolomyces articulosus TaxID=60185 RepID=A0AAD5K4M0_9FUNG|nr:hypothetical protein BDA99DRAFT_596965 [Phascolomyces articulosus]
MQIKFITLTVSAILALSAISANAAPTGQESTTQPDATTGNKSVQPQSAGQVAPVNKEALGSDNLLDIVGELLDKVVNPLLKEVLQTVYKLLDTLLGNGGSGNREGTVRKLVDNVLKLVGLNEGALTGKPATGEPKGTNTGNIVSDLLAFLENLLAGHSSEAAAGGDPKGLVDRLLSGLLGGGKDAKPEAGRQRGGEGAGQQRGSEGAVLLLPIKRTGKFFSYYIGFNEFRFNRKSEVCNNGIIKVKLQENIQVTVEVLSIQANDQINWQNELLGTSPPGSPLQLVPFENILAPSF